MEKAKILCTSLCLILFLTPCFASLEESVRINEQKYIPSASVGILVSNLKTNKVIYDLNANHTFQPASNIKILLASAALMKLGPNYRFITQAWLDSQDLLIQFSGDPSFRSRDLAELFSILKDKEISGNIIIDQSRFSNYNYPRGIMLEDQNWYYN